MPQQSEALVKVRRKKPWLAGHASSSCRGSYCIRKEIERDGEIKLRFMNVFFFHFFLVHNSRWTVMRYSIDSSIEIRSM
jgi:hypothetical protein